MKTTTASTLVVAALAGLASAQQLPKFGLPNCAVSDNYLLRASVNGDAANIPSSRASAIC